MMRVLLLLLTASTRLPSCGAIRVDQQKKLLIVKTGDSVNLTCEQDQSTFFNMYWYQQKPERGLKLMVLSLEVNKPVDMEEGYKATWTLWRPTVYNSTLTLKASSPSDSAVYFCAASRQGGTVAYFGAGTVLSVLGVGEQVRAPKVTIYAPNKNELEDNNDFISLVCIASNFFPEHVKIRWFVNNEERVNLYEPIPQIKEDNSSYSTSKRLILTKSEYFNVDSVFRCQAAFLNGDHETSVEVTGEAGCGMSKESYSMRINEGKISYIIVLCKSGLYALIVLALLWRKKLILSSY